MHGIFGYAEGIHREFCSLEVRWITRGPSHCATAFVTHSVKGTSEVAGSYIATADR